MTRRITFISLWALAVLGAAGTGGAPPQPMTGGAAAPQADAKRFTTADDLLTGLESADIRTLRGEIKYTVDSGNLEGRVRTERRGVVYYDTNLPRDKAAADEVRSPNRRGVAVLFKEMTVDDARRDQQRDFIFDGEWLVERYPGDKQFFKRRVAPAGEVADPLRIGAGPFPIPIGQRRADIVARFDATLVDKFDGLDPSESRPAEMVQRDGGTYQLKLIPKAGTDEARELKEVRIWYRRSDLLPRMARTVNRENGRAEVVLINLVRNEPVDPKLFDTTPPLKEDGWQVQVDEFRKRVDERP